MNDIIDVSAEEIRSLTDQLVSEAESGGYHINPDMDITLGLVRGLLVNERRYGYRSCPCRLASGNREDDLDIVCPCNYRDADVEEYGTCYCGLYVSRAVMTGEKILESIPERRPPKAERDALKAGKNQPKGGPGDLPLPVWRCQVCGYLCARDGPPGVCPICKANKDRFERFM